MIKFSRATLGVLEEELQAISFDNDHPIPLCDKAIASIVKHLKTVKEYALQHQFQNDEDEIQFFKTIKPKFTSKLIYYKKVRKLESCIPVGLKKKQLEFYDQELNKLNIYFNENLEFYNYYRLGSDFLDKKLFIRANAVIDYNLESFYYELDDRFSTTHDFKVATIIANEIFLKYIENKISNFSNNKPKPPPPPITAKIIKWTESKTSLIEMIYAFHAQQAFNYGKIDIAEIAKYFEKVFDIDLGDIYRVQTEIKNRKINRTKYLDILKEVLIKRFFDLDNRQ